MERPNRLNDKYWNGEVFKSAIYIIDIHEYVNYIEEQLEKERKPNKGDIKHYCTKFFYWWFNNKGTNTEQGFDKWWLENGQFMQLTQNQSKDE